MRKVAENNRLVGHVKLYLSMKKLFKLTTYLFIVLFLACGVVWFFQKNKVKNINDRINGGVLNDKMGGTLESNEGTFSASNTVEVISGVPLPKQEQDSLLVSIDSFMSEYRLPKGLNNSYKVDIRSRLHDSIKIIINPEDLSSGSKTVLYAHRENGIWKVDSNGGPWCSLEEFDANRCR
jgi:hypothetical protein